MSEDFIDEMFSAVDEYYPGSKRKRRATEQEAPKVKETKTWDSRPYVKTMPNGVDMELFTLGSLADALGRPVITVRDWVRKGYLPTAPYRLPTVSNKNGDPHQGRRLYSRAMIESVVEIFGQAGLLNGSRVEWSDHKQVTEDIATVWNKIRIEQSQ
jgi:hypothetical protein